MTVTLLTGASSGIGAALAPLLAADGHRVALAARRAAPLAEVADAIRAAGGEAMVLPLDVTDRDAVQAAVAEVAAAWGPVELLVANAGIGDAMAAHDYDSRRVARVIEVNLTAAAHCIDAVLPAMLAAGRGHIVGIGSLAGDRGLPGNGAYCASKAGLRVLLEALRIELRGKGIAVTHVAPGFVESPLTARNDFAMPFILPTEAGAREVLRAIRRQQREHRFPWPLAALSRLGRMLPAPIYERLLAGRVAQKAPDPRNAAGVDRG
ncbi:MAG: SDR family NAD(P)-dependent oxidoreductase [bacterium]